MKFFRERKWSSLIGLLVIIGLIALATRRPGDTNAALTETEETAVAFVGTLSDNVTATGQVLAQREATLSLTRAGTVQQVNIIVGDLVNQGDVLVQLETDALQRAVASAQADVTIAQAELADLLAGATEAELAAAQAAVLSAQIALDEKRAGPTAEEIAASEAAVAAAPSQHCRRRR